MQSFFFFFFKITGHLKISQVFNVHINTINNWAGRRAVEEINRIYGLDGRGVKPIFTEADMKISTLTEIFVERYAVKI